MLEAAVAPRARIEYLIAYGPTDYRLDPHNPRPGLTQPEASEFVMPGYVPPQEFVDPPASPAGQVDEALVESQALGGLCRLTVYTPPGYRRDGRYALAVFANQPAGPVPRVLDWLIARRAIEPIVAVFVDTGVRGENHDPGARTGSFLASELLTWLAPRYGIDEGADRRAILGISFSAKDALDAALATADAFGRLGLLIPGRRISAADIETIAGKSSRRLRVAILQVSTTVRTCRRHRACGRRSQMPGTRSSTRKCPRVTHQERGATTSASSSSISSGPGTPKCGSDRLVAPVAARIARVHLGVAGPQPHLPYHNFTFLHMGTLPHNIPP